MQPRYVDVERFKVGDPGAQRHLEEHGFVVFKHALSLGEADEALGLMWDYLEGLGTGIRRDDAGTWGDDRWPPTVDGTGILPFFGVGQSAFMWYVRTRPLVAGAFRSLWGRDKLVCSFDGCALWRPGERTRDGWLHVDQHPRHQPGFSMIQGFVNLIPVDGARSGGNVVVDASHRDVFPRLAVDYAHYLNQVDYDYLELPPTDPAYGLGARHLTASLDKGDLMCWDSRTAHCSSPARAVPAPDDDGDENDENENGGGGDAARRRARTIALVRAVAFVCFAPDDRLSDQVRAWRRGAVSHSVTTTHWPTKFQPTHLYDTFANLPDAYKARFSLPPPPNLLKQEILDAIG